MRKLLFVHDHVFLQGGDGKIYSPGGFPSSLWNKYLEHCDTLNVIGRFGGRVSSAENNHVLSTHENVQFNFVDKLSNPVALIKNGKKVAQNIADLVRNSDCVIARLPSENGLIAIDEAIKQGKPICIEVVGCIWDGLWNYGSILAKLYAPLAYMRMRSAVKRSNFVLYVTNHFLQSRYPCCQGITTVSASNVMVHTKEANWSKRNYGKKITFGLIGNYKTKYKGIDIAIRALAKAKWLDKEFEFRILGKGDSLEYKLLAKELGVEDSVYFDDPLPSGKPVWDWLDNIDVYMQPSLQEGLPRSLIEAMSRGCVALGSTTGGIPELIEDKFIHPAGNVSLLSKTIDNLMLEKNEFDQISKRNIDESRKYDHEIITLKRQSFFSKFIKG
jgi:glycosyltransferase involved in cell wall biosynthesis